MPKLDNNIYGLDETSMASECASAALSGNALKEWEGAPTGAAQAKGGMNKTDPYDSGDVVVKDEACKPDSRVKSMGGGAAPITWTKKK